MPFKKGQSGNPKGKPKGSKNKSVRRKIEALIKRNLIRIEKEITTATPEQQRGFLIELSAALSSNLSADQNETGI